MKQACLHCERITAGGNLWCLEPDCATAGKPEVFDYGESLADLNIDKLEAVLPTGAVYRATRETGETVLLKVAHKGRYFEERLKREAAFLAGLQQSKTAHPVLPVLLPPYVHAGLEQFSYGRSVHRGETRYYLILEHFTGESVRSWLLRNPQPWFQHVAWLMIGLAGALDILHQRQMLHATLIPEAIFLRFDRERIPRPVLIDLGLISDHQTIAANWQPALCPTAWTAPELLQSGPRKIGRRTDVYGLGLLMYEMLAGVPAWPSRLRTSADVRQQVLAGRLPPISREVSGLPEIAMRATSRSYDARQESAGQVAVELLQHFPPIPRERKPRVFNWRIFGLVMAILIIVSLLLATAVALYEPVY